MRYKFKIGEMVKIGLGFNNSGKYAFVLIRERPLSKLGYNEYRVIVQGIEHPVYYSEPYLEKAE